MASSELSQTAEQPTSLFNSLSILFRQLPRRRRLTIIPLLALMLSGAIAEVFTLGALLPFLAAVSDPDQSKLIQTLKPAFANLGVVTSHEMLIALGGLFALASLLATTLRIFLLRASQSFVYGISYEIGVKLYRETLAQPYDYHIRHNSSEIIASINKTELVTNGVLMPLMGAIVATAITLSIIFGLVVIDPLVAIASGGGFFLIYAVTSLATRTKLKRNAGIIAESQQSRVHAMQEGLGGIRDVLIDGSQSVFVETYERAEAGLRDARSHNAMIASSPRFIVEGVGLILIMIIAIVLSSRQGGFASAIPTLGALALGAQKLLPLIQQIYMGWASAVGNQQVIKDIASLLNRTAPISSESTTPITFQHLIQLKNVGHSYLNNRVPALNRISLDIQKGVRLGIAGKTGSGKSTLLDIVLGLLEPSLGSIQVDGVPITADNCRAWQKHIAHVPQSIFLADCSIAENIAFGVKKSQIDMDRVYKAADQAELGDVIAALPEGYATTVGERGIQLSGGQRQRIGIARALYKRASVLVLDEATSALDSSTEAAVMAAIERLDRGLTIIIVAHRHTTLELCDLVVFMERGTIVKTVENNRAT